MSVFIRYILNHHKKQAFLLGILGLLSSLTSVIMSLTLKYSVDVLFSVENSHGTIAILLFFLMAVTTYLSDQIGENYLLTKYQAKFVHRLRRNLIDSYLSLPYDKAREHDMGELMNRDDVAAELGDLYVSVVYNLPYCVLESVGFIIFLAVAFSWKMDVILLVLIPFALLLKTVMKEMQRTNGEINRKKAMSHNFFLDVLSKVDFVKANGMTALMERKYGQKNDLILGLQRRLYGYNSLMRFSQFLLENMVAFLVPAVGVWMMQNGDITPGGVTVSTTVFATFLVPSLFQAIELVKEIGRSKTVAEDVIRKAECEKKNMRKKTGAMNPDILIRADRVSHKSRNKVLLDNVSLTLPVKGCVGICGPSGEGKSTFLKMIAGLLEPDEGRIIYNAEYFSEENICERIAYLNSDVFFMDDTVLENVKAGGDGWEKALRLREMDRLLRHLPEKEQTVLINNADNLSGGQRQLLGFARALAKTQAAVILLDEPAASLDRQTQKEIGKLICGAAKEKCVVVVTHQMELLSEMPQSYRLERGRLTEMTGRGFE